MEKLIMIDPKAYIASEVEPQIINGYLADGWTVKSVTPSPVGGQAYVIVVIEKK